MALSIRQILKGRKSTYRLVEALKPATVFKAQILSSSSFETGLYGLENTHRSSTNC